MFKKSALFSHDGFPKNICTIKYKTTIRNPNKVAPYVAPVGTWGDFEDSGGGSCADETDTCDARFFLLPILSILL